MVLFILNLCKAVKSWIRNCNVVFVVANSFLFAYYYSKMKSAKCRLSVSLCVCFQFCTGFVSNQENNIQFFLPGRKTKSHEANILKSKTSVVTTRFILSDALCIKKNRNHYWQNDMVADISGKMWTILWINKNAYQYSVAPHLILWF